MKRKPKAKKFVFFIILLLLTCIFSFLKARPRAVYAPGDNRISLSLGRDYDYGNILVRRVVDGDTIQLENRERVRLIGIDTPEMHDSDKLYRDSRKSSQDPEVIKGLGRQSYQFTKSLVEGKRVKLEFDLERQDKYKRLLAYVYLKDGTFVNAEIVQQGYASLMTIPPNVKYADLFLKLYQEARKNQRGLWK